MENDSEYYDDLKDRYSIIIKQVEKVGADKASLDIIKRLKKILEALRSYYKADVAK